MKFEIVKNRRIFFYALIMAVVLLITLIISASLAKFQMKESIKIVSGTINYSPYDFMVDGIFIQNDSGYVEVDEVPESGYVFNSSESYCSKNGEVLTDVILEYDMSTKTFNLTNYTQKAIKCYLYFDEQSGIEILATIDGTSSSTFPTKGSEYTPTSVSCTNDATATFDYVDWAVEVDNVETTTCTVNFESNKNTSFATYLKNKICSSAPTSDSAAKDCLVNENGYRYEGSNPNNYVLFNDELWRIIGVFSIKNSSGTSADLVKIIRNEMLDALAWDGANSNKWSTATIQTTLNDSYLNATDSTCSAYSTTVSKTCKFSENGLNSIAREMVESVVWNLGGTSTDVGTAATMYSYERGTTVYSGNPTTWTGKVALMYPSDYGYSVLASSCARTTEFDNYTTSECAGSSWLFAYSDQWTLTHHSTNSAYVFTIDNSGYLNNFYTRYSYGIRPTVYLKSTINILGGLGTMEAPYIIE